MLLLAAEIWLACAASLLVSTPAAAQFWDYPFWGQRQAPQQRQYRPWGGWQQGPEQQQRWSQPPVDASKAPPPRKPESAPAKTVAVLGDSMADWLGFGLEDAFAETPEIGVTRKNRTYSGLIRGESRKEFDWPQSAKEILAAWNDYLPKFRKVMPVEYRRALAEMKATEVTVPMAAAGA